MSPGEKLWSDDEPTWPGATLCKRVLVAEDDADMRELMLLVLREQGYDVATVVNGAELLHVLGTLSGADVDPFDLIVTDVRMPGASGLDAVDRLRRDGNATPVIAVTGFPSDLIRERAERLAIRLLPKPFELDALRSAVDSILKPAPATGARAR